MGAWIPHSLDCTTILWVSGFPRKSEHTGDLFSTFSDCPGQGCQPIPSDGMEICPTVD